MEPEKIVKPTGGRWILTLVIGLSILVVGLGAYIVYGYYKDKKADESKVTASATAVVSRVASDKVVDDGISWIKPEKLEDLGLFKAVTGQENVTEYKGADYYKVANITSGGDVVLAMVKTEGMGNLYDFHRFIRRNGKVTWIEKNSTPESESQDVYTVAFTDKNIETDATYSFKSLLPDATINNKSTDLVLQDHLKSASFVQATGGTKVGETKWGDLYLLSAKELENSSGNVKIGQYYIALNDSTKAGYEPKPVFMRDDNTLDLEFTVETEKANAFKFEKMTTSGCGLGYGSIPIAKTSALADKKLLGTSAKSSKVYYLDNKDSDLVKYAYDIYKSDGSPNKKSIDDFVANYGVVFWTDDYGTTIIYQNADYKPQAECGKPVVYLYPKTDTAVKVRVGAKITKSDPLYASGWEVLAKPNGQLISGGLSYPYLFWEGLGFGQYPEITSGAVVPRSSVEAKISQDLTYIGLNKQEISDFNDFWLPKIPNTPYVRLTWLQNKEMDELAPLQITPRPDSVIRVFLDFKGLEANSAISKQELIQYPRNGFTAVEWGGLLAQ